jgi:acetyl-CoA carboxylase biotin carboxyl carrier protein
MVGKIIAVVAEIGRSVDVDDEQVTFESMKMEIPADSTSTDVMRPAHMATGDVIQENDLLVTIDVQSSIECTA